MRASTVSEAAVARPVGSELTPLGLLRVFGFPLGFLTFTAALALAAPADRLVLLGLTAVTGTLILVVVSVDRLLRVEQRSLLLSLFSFAYFVYFVLPVFIFYVGESGYTTQHAPNPLLLRPTDVARGMAATLVSYAMLLVGFALPFGGIFARIVPRMTREWSAEIALAVAMLTIPLGWIVTLASQIGLIPARVGTGVLGTIANGTLYGIALIYLCYLRYHTRAALLLLALVVPATMFFNFFTSSKGLFVRPLVLMGIAYVIVTRKIHAWWIVGFIAFMALFYPVGMAYRNYMVEHDLTAVQVIVRPQRAFWIMIDLATHADPVEYVQAGITATASRLNALGILSVIMRDAGTRVPFQGGWSIAFIPMSYVPRLLWPEKPRFETGQWVTDNFGSGPLIKSSTGSSWMGELYFNFGWKGIVLGMGLIGVWLRFLSGYFLRIDATIPSMLGGIVAIMTIATSLGGDLLTPANGVAFYVTPIVLVHLLIGQFAPRPRRAPAPL